MDEIKNGISISRMSKEHLGGVCEIEKACFSTPWSLESFTYEVEKNPFSYYYVALCAGEAIAYGGMHHVIDEGQITNIAVHPDFRRLGIGRALLSRLVETSKELSITLMTLEVRSMNASAISLYEGMGFSQIGRRGKYYDNPVDDALLLGLIL